MRKVYLVTKDDYASSDAVMAFESEEEADLLKKSLDSRMYEVLLASSEKLSLHNMIQAMRFAEHRQTEEETDGEEN